MSMGKLLVTGAAGFIGMDLCSKAHKAGYEVQAIDAFRGGLYSSKVKQSRAKRLGELFGIKVEEADLSTGVFELKNDLTHVIHAAAMPGLSYSFSDPNQYISDNEVATLNLVRALENTDLQKFVFISTSSVYGKYADGDEDLFMENTRTETKIRSHNQYRHMD
jgi:nucleoside-diphosphate-sugar epimerase